MTQPEAQGPWTALLSHAPGEVRVALLDGETVWEVGFFRDSLPLPGDIFLGRMGKALPGGSAAFVEIGAAQAGFLPAAACPHHRLPPEGQAVVVRITRPPQGEKGARLELQAGPVPPLTPAPGGQTPPCRLHGVAPPLPRLLAGRPVARVLCEGPGAVSAARLACPEGTEITPWTEGLDLFADLGVEDALEAALAPRWTLPSGGVVQISETPALTAIDIDTAAGGDVARVNQEAVAVLPRLVRLRSLCGQIVIDFAAPARKSSAEKQRCANALAVALRADPVPARVLGVTAGGLVEVRRDRQGIPLSDLLQGPLRRGDHPEALALAGLRAVERAVRHTPALRPRLILAEAAAALLTGPALAAARQETERRLGGPLVVEGRVGARMTIEDSCS